jgi:hypothetical protein
MNPRKKNIEDDDSFGTGSRGGGGRIKGEGVARRTKR